jgi:hypothetical protein
MELPSRSKKFAPRGVAADSGSVRFQYLEGVDKINDRGTVSYCIGVGSDLAAAITGVHETYLNSVS